MPKQVKGRREVDYKKETVRSSGHHSCWSKFRYTLICSDETGIAYGRSSIVLVGIAPIMVLSFRKRGHISIPMDISPPMNGSVPALR